MGIPGPGYGPFLACFVNSLLHPHLGPVGPVQDFLASYLFGEVFWVF